MCAAGSAALPAQLQADAAMQRANWRIASPVARLLQRPLLPALPRHAPLAAAATTGRGPQFQQHASRDSTSSSHAYEQQDQKLQQRPLHQRMRLPRRSSRLTQLSQPLRSKHFGQQPTPGTFFRFWHDEKRFKGTGETSLVQRALLAAGGVRTGGNVKAAPLSGPMGWQRVADWDVLWSPSATALKAADFLRPGQLISTVPGLFAITKKKRMPASLHAAYGSDAWDIIPPTYSIPTQLQQWRGVLREEALQQKEEALQRRRQQQQQQQQQWQQQQGSQGGEGEQVQHSVAEERSGGEVSTSGRLEQQAVPETGLWILKTAQHLGKGLKVVQTRTALKELVDRNKHFLRLPPGSKAALAAQKAQETEDSMDGQEASDSTKAAQKPERPYVAAQRYVTNPLLIDGHKFGIRVWVLVLGPSPLRAYMHSNGLVLFSSEAYQPAAWAAEDGSVAPGHVTNYAQNVDGTVWPVDRLEQHLGQQQYRQLWARMERASALAVAAAAAGVQEAAARLGSPPESAFELLGLDFLVDTNLQPFLLEINATPSLAVEHSNADTATMIHQQKNGMVLDMLSLLRLRQRFGGPAGSTAGNTADGLHKAESHGDGTAAGAMSLLQGRAMSDTNAAPDAGIAVAMHEAERTGLKALVAAAAAAHGSTALQEALQHQPQLLERLVDVECEIQASQGWVPLLSVMPYDAAERGWVVPWGPEDLALAEYWELRKAVVPTKADQGHAPTLRDAGGAVQSADRCWQQPGQEKLQEMQVTVAVPSLSI